MSNFHHPRALIELHKSSHDDGDKQKETKNICTILLEIERVNRISFNFNHFNSRLK